MEALSTLRESIVHRAPPKDDGGALVFTTGGGTVKYPKTTKTPFKRSAGGYYQLGSLWLQWVHRDSGYKKLAQVAKEQGMGVVLVTEKPQVLAYLTGKDDGGELIDRAFAGDDAAAPQAAVKPAAGAGSGVAAGAGAGVGAGAGAALPRAAADAVPPEVAVLSHEKPLQTAVTALDGPSAEMRNTAFVMYQQMTESKKRKLTAAREAVKEGEADPVSAVASGRKPIIVVPNAPSSLVTLYNVRQLLGEGRYVPSQQARREAGGARLTSVEITRTINGAPVTFLVVDSVAKLRSRQWKDLAAVLALGPAWQFKGWTLGGPKPVRPVDIFTHTLGFHFHTDDKPVPDSVKISKTRRHLDVIAANKFWAAVEGFVKARRTHLMPSTV